MENQEKTNKAELPAELPSRKKAQSLFFKYREVSNSLRKLDDALYRLEYVEKDEKGKARLRRLAQKHITALLSIFPEINSELTQNEP